MQDTSLQEWGFDSSTGQFSVLEMPDQPVTSKPDATEPLASCTNSNYFLKTERVGKEEGEGTDDADEDVGAS